MHATISGRPESTEHAPYYASYISLVPGADALAALSDQLSAVRRFFSAIPESRAGDRYAPDKWSVRQVLGHVIDAERVFGYRALCIARGEKASLPAFDENEYVRNAPFDLHPLAGLLDEFAAARESHLRMFRHFAPGVWQNRGVANRNEVTVRALGFIMAGHVAHHMEVVRTRYGLDPAGAGL